MAGWIFLTLGILSVATKCVLSDGYFGYPTRDVGQRQTRRCPTCPADSPESLSSPWYGSPKVYGQEISFEPSSGLFDRRPSASSVTLHRGFNRGTQNSNFESSPPAVKNVYRHPASGSSNSYEDSRRPSTNWNSRSETSELISPDHRHEDSSTKFGSLESHDFPYDLIASSSQLPERYQELADVFGKPHQAPTRRVGRHYGNANENPSSDEEYEKSPNRLGAIETPSRKMVWVVYRADAGPESSSIENCNFVTVPTRAEGERVAKILHPEEPMSDAQLEEVVRRAIAAATREHRREDALYGRSRGTHRVIHSDEHRRGDEEISHDSGREFRSGSKKFHGNRLGGTEVRQTGSHPVTRTRTYFAPSGKNINAGRSGNRQVIAGGGYGEEDAGIIYRVVEPEVTGWEDQEEGDVEEKEMDDFRTEEKDEMEKPTSYFGLPGESINSGLTGNRKVIAGIHYSEKDDGIVCYKEEPEVPEVPEGIGREEHSWSGETGWLRQPEVARLPVEKSSTHLTPPGRNINVGSSGNRKVITGSHYGEEDAGIIFYKEEPEVPEVPEVAKEPEVPEGTGREEHSWSEEGRWLGKPEAARLPVTKPRTFFPTSDRNINTGSSTDRKIIAGSHYGEEDAGIAYYKKGPEVPEVPKVPEVPEGTGREEHSRSEETARLRQLEVTRLPVTKPRTSFAPPGRNINPGFSGNRKIIAGSHYGNEDAGVIFYEKKPEVTGRKEQPEVTRHPGTKPRTYFAPPVAKQTTHFRPPITKQRTHLAPSDGNINTGSTENRKIITGLHHGDEDAGVISYEDKNINHGSTENRRIITGSHHGDEDARIISYEDKNINHGSTENRKIITGSHHGEVDAGSNFYEAEPKVTGQKEHSRHPVMKPGTDFAPPDRNINTGSTGNRKIITSDEVAEIICYKEGPEVTGRKEHSPSVKDEQDEVKNGDDWKKSAPISSDRFRTVEHDGKPEVRPKLTNYRTQSRSHQEVSTIRQEEERGHEKVDKIEESTKAPSFRKENGRHGMVGEMNPDFFEDMENPSTVTQPPLRLNFGSPEASTPSPSI